MNKFAIILIICLHSILSVKADSWTDPSWKEMVDSSDLVALIEYSSDGDFRARANIIETYKGESKSSSIWISGFSNRYGPIDSVKKGDKFIVFLTYHEPTDRSISYWTEQAKEKKKYEPYLNSLKNGRCYYVWSPTSGDLKVKNDKVQYDLVQTSFYSKQEYYPLKEFIVFLRSLFKEKNSDFQTKLIKKLSFSPSHKSSSQHIMMLYLSGYITYNEIYEKVEECGTDEARFALSMLLGQIKGVKSRELLIKLLHSENSVVQGEAVRQLSKKEDDSIGEILLKSLDSAGEEGLYPRDIMNPLRNSLDGGKLEIIKALGKLKYKPAIPKLLPLISTENSYQFNLIIGVLQELESNDYIPYLNKELEKGNTNLLFDIGLLMVKDSLVDCIPSMMKFISTHDKTEHPSREVAISNCCGLGHFNNQEVLDFLKEDFKEVLKMKSGGTIDGKEDWIEAYLELFIKKEIPQIKPLAYESLHDYFGLNSSFKDNPSLFDLKEHLEDSISRVTQEIIKNSPYKRVEVNVKFKMNDNKPYILNYTIDISMNELNKDIADTIIEKVTSKGIEKNHMIIRKDNFSYGYGATEFGNYNTSLLMKYFLKYLAKNPDTDDIRFIKNLIKHSKTKNLKDYSLLDKYLEEANNNFKKK